jgi:hypothetical protein
MALEFVLLSPGFNYFLLLRKEQNSRSMCLLLTSSMSFVDLPLQEHQMMEKHHMDQNPYRS